MGSSVASALRRASVACCFGPPERRAPTRRGELKSLDALGIVSLDVTAKPLDATTPQGARLTGYGDVARNLDRAIQLEWKTGDSREFNLRNYAIDFDTLDEVNSTDDSTYRVEMLTPARKRSGCEQ